MACSEYSELTCASPAGAAEATPAVVVSHRRAPTHLLATLHLRPRCPSLASETDGTGDGTLRVQLAASLLVHLGHRQQHSTRLSSSGQRERHVPSSAASIAGILAGPVVSACMHHRRATPEPTSRLWCDRRRERGRTPQETWPDGLAHIAAVARSLCFNSRVSGAAQLQSGAQSTTPSAVPAQAVRS